MGIVQPPLQVAGTSGIYPNFKYMVTTDTLDTVLAAGYLNNIDLAVFPITTADVLQVLYSFNQQTNSGSYGIFTVSISNGTITLNNNAPADLGQAAFKNVSDDTQPNVSSVVETDPTPVPFDLIVFNDSLGTIRDAGYYLYANVFTYGGGATSVTITDANITASCVPFANLQSSTNNVSITKATQHAGSITIAFSADPGANTVISYCMFSTTLS